MTVFRFFSRHGILVLGLLVFAASGSAHTLLHLMLFQTSRTVELFPNHLDVRYEGGLACDLNTSSAAMIADVNGDGKLEPDEVDGVSTTALEYLAMDATAFIDKSQLTFQTVSAAVSKDKRGFTLLLRAPLPGLSDGVTTHVLTVIDPAYAFPSLDPKLKFPDTRVICHGSVFVDKNDRPVQSGWTPAKTSTVILWKPGQGR